MSTGNVHFKIISSQRGAWPWIRQTVDSILGQAYTNYEVCIIDDASGIPELTAYIAGVAEAHPDRVKTILRDRPLRMLRNQVDAIRLLNPGPEDVIVFLDGDGDRFAHEHVLERLARFYADPEVWMTYGSFKPIPAAKTCTPAAEIPARVIEDRSYRRESLTVSQYWNHLRTMRGKVFAAIPDDHFRWPSGPKRGQFYEAGPDYVIMTAGLELADTHHRFIPEILCFYRHDYDPLDLTRQRDTGACTQNYLRRASLAPLESTPRSQTVPDNATLTAEERREVLRDFGQRLGLKTLIETGTNDGGTPWELQRDFQEIYTIELGRQQWAAAKKRFAGLPHIHCLLGDSGVVLPEVLAKITEPALLWLDGHTSGGATARGPKDTPIVEELEAVFRSGIDHVVLVDDARLFAGMPGAGEWDWPHVDVIKEIAARVGYQFEILDDIIRLTPQ